MVPFNSLVCLVCSTWCHTIFWSCERFSFPPSTHSLLLCQTTLLTNENMTTTHDKERQTDARRVDIAQRRNTGCYAHASKIPVIYIILSQGYFVQVDFGWMLGYSLLICRIWIGLSHYIFPCCWRKSFVWSNQRYELHLLKRINCITTNLFLNVI